MKIEYFGHSCFRMTSDSGIQIVTDPFDGVGYRLPRRLDAHLVTVSHAHFDHNNVRAIHGNPTILDEWGSFDFGGIKIEGMLAWHDDKQGELRGSNVIYRFVIDGITVCHLGDLGEPCSERLGEILKDADIWMIPVGGTYTLDARQAMEYVEKFKPRAVIPMHYHCIGCTLNIKTVKDFLDRVDVRDVWQYSEGVYTPDTQEFEEERTRIIFMERI